MIIRAMPIGPIGEDSSSFSRILSSKESIVCYDSIYFMNDLF